MPDPPDVSLLIRFVYESPYTLGIGLLVVGGVLGWLGLRDGRSSRLRLALVPLVLGVAVLVVGRLAVTSGERARVVTRSLIDAVAAEDVAGAMSRFGDDARLHFGSATNIGYDVGSIEAQLERLVRRYSIERNQVLALRSYTIDGDAAVVHVSCLTTAATGSARSRWVIEVERQPDASWAVARLTCVTVNSRTPRALR